MSSQGAYSASRIRGLSVRDIRFPTSLKSDGSDAVHTDPDYSCTYVVLYTDTNFKGFGLSFTIGRGNELVVEAVKSLSYLVVGKNLNDIYDDFGATWRSLTSESQLRWVGPEKGVVHLGVAALVNALWDLWARIQHKPLWKLLVDMEPERLVSTIDFRYIEDVLTREEAVQMLKEMQKGKKAREERMLNRGYPAYTTGAGWLGYSQERTEALLKQYLSQGWTHFKIKVGQNLEEDKRRCQIVRDIIGEDKTLMVDANQKWNVNEAIDWMKELAPYKPLWIEEPTSPDDILGHAAIAKALNPLGIGVATGEMCQNRVIFKQLLQAGAIQYCQIDACRVGGVNEVLSIYLMAKKFKVPVCPHAGGVGLCEMVQHLQIWDYISVSGTSKDRIVEHADQLSEHFKTPIKLSRCHYLAPKVPGYSVEMWEKTLLQYEYPYGSEWNKMFAEGKFLDPRTRPPPYVEHRAKADITLR